MQEKNLKNTHVGLMLICKLFTRDHEIINDGHGFAALIKDVLKRYDLTLTESTLTLFPPKDGFTAIIGGCKVINKLSTPGFILANGLMESHVFTHTWKSEDPEEYCYVTIQIYVCNYSRNNSESCRKIMGELIAFFNPVEYEILPDVWI